MTARPAAARPGISLIEVLLALAIFLLSLVSIGRLVDMGTDNARDANAQATGIRLAQSKLAEVEAGVLPVTGGSGSVEDEPDWEYAIDSVQTDVPNVYDVTVRVTHARNGRPITVTMSQMVFDPLQSGTAAEAQRPQAAMTTSGGTGP